MKNALKIHRDKDHRAYRIHKYILVRFDQKRANIGQILVRFLGNIGQTVDQILESLSQILTTSTLHKGVGKCDSRIWLGLTLKSVIYIT